MENLEAAVIEPVTMSDVLALDTWNQPRSIEYLREDRENRLAALALSDQGE